MGAPQNFRSALNGFNREDVVHYLEYLNAKHTAQVNQLNADVQAAQLKQQDLQRELDSKAGLVDRTQEVEDLKSQLESAKAQADSLRTQCQELEQKVEDLETAPDHALEVEKLQKSLDAANADRAELRSQCADLKQQLEDKSMLPVGPDPEEMNRLHAMLDNATSENAALRAQAADLRQQVSAAAAAPDPQELIRLQDRIAQLNLENEELRNRSAQLQGQLDEKAAAPSYSAEDELEAYRRAERAERVANQRADQIYQRVNLMLSNATTRVDGVSGQLTGAADRFNAQLAELQAAVTAAKLALGDAVDTMYALRPEETK